MENYPLIFTVASYLEHCVTGYGKFKISKESGSLEVEDRAQDKGVLRIIQRLFF